MKIDKSKLTPAELAFYSPLKNVTVKRRAREQRE